jgi:hypothetical protein
MLKNLLAAVVLFNICAYAYTAVGADSSSLEGGGG